MRNFMSYGVGNDGTDPLRIARGKTLDGLLENRDFIRKDKGVSRAAMREWNPLVQPQQHAAAANIGLARHSTPGTVFDDKSDIRHLCANMRRNREKSVRDQLFKRCPFHCLSITKTPLHAEEGPRMPRGTSVTVHCRDYLGRNDCGKL